MALLKSIQSSQGRPVPNADRAVELIPIVGDYTFTGAEATSDVVEVLPLPAGMVLVDVIVDSDDAGTTVTANVGLLTGAWRDTGARTCGAEIMLGKALGTPGIYRADVAGFGRIAPATGDRSVGFALTAVTTPTAGAKVRMTALARPQQEAA